MGWRKWAISGLLKASGSGVPASLAYIKESEFASGDHIRIQQEEKLTKLITFCYENVPYYKTVLEHSGVVSGGLVKLERYNNIPPLTKKVIRENYSSLLPGKYSGTGRYENTSGGSTGEVASFYQDKRYDCWNIANKIYFNRVLGKNPGDKEIKLWGSDRDIIAGSLTLKDKIINFLYNRLFFNCYHLDQERLEKLRLLNNSFKPCGYWSYMEAAAELAEYIEKSGRKFYSPKMIISTIGPLNEQLRNKIEKALGCNVYNQYGSREVGAIACECKEKNGLHTFPWSHFVEVVGDDYKSVAENQEGQILVTPLENYAMPLLRYSIGDVGVNGGSKCQCGRNTFKLGAVKGRTLGYFIKPDGSKVHSHFIVQGLFFRDWIERFQIVQEKLDYVVIYIKKRGGVEFDQGDIEEIKTQSRLLLGQQCRIDIDFVSDISRSESGKFLYTICKVNCE
ncbi:MAG: phenylacetate--CoA ligase family protein [Sedimentisphaeraceae bacterium JB056]